MGRDHSYMDEAFRGPRYDPFASASFTLGVVGVMMPLGPAMSEVFATIRVTCESLDLVAKRADDSVGSGIVLRDIVEIIEDSELLIFDLTHERPNVYYELGFAHGVGNESADILLIAKSGTQLHFDIAPIRVRYYDSIHDLAHILTEALPKMLQVSRTVNRRTKR